MDTIGLAAILFGLAVVAVIALAYGRGGTQPTSVALRNTISKYGIPQPKGNK